MSTIRNIYCNIIYDNANLGIKDYIVYCVSEGFSLEYADLSRADLSGANLRYADLSGANLRYADLSGANLSYANLSDVYLSGANLSGANLSGAYLRGANLSGANLSGAYLRDAYLRDADLRDVTVNYLTIGYQMSCPEEGAFIGYKKCGEQLVKLLILEDSLRSSSTTSKCRCNKAKVLSIEPIGDSATYVLSVASSYDKSFIYTVGEIVEVSNFNTNRWNECTTGIHFFVNKKNAIAYNY